MIELPQGKSPFEDLDGWIVGWACVAEGKIPDGTMVGVSISVGLDTPTGTLEWIQNNSEKALRDKHPEVTDIHFEWHKTATDVREEDDE